MQLYIYDNAEQVAKATSLMFASQLLEKPDSVFGFATGSSPIKSYQEIVKLYEQGIIDFSRATSFNLDEYVGVPYSSPVSYHCFMQDNLFKHINLKESFVPEGLEEDSEKACRSYDEKIRSCGGIDIQLLGIGRNGHIGFNEPADSFSKGTQIVSLTKSTIEANKRFFEKEEDVPRTAISMGIMSIFEARKIVLIATGEDKKEAVFGLVKGEIDPRLPASVLQLHKNCVVLTDRAAASLI